MNSKDASVSVLTNQGRIDGFQQSCVNTFLGIRYAAPPLGSKRFTHPHQIEPSAEITKATVLGAPSLQSNPDFPAWIDPNEPSEDCLFINVWAPKDAQNLPVMFWVHGGAFIYGSAGAPVYDGKNLAKKGEVVVVSINHRLNALGYLWLGDLYPELELQGNPGQADIVAALEWVQKNISNFGGDPFNVTIFGESGGGAKITGLLAGPGWEQYFHKAIIQSGAITDFHSRESATEVAKVFLEEIGATDANLETLLELSGDEIARASEVVSEKLGPLAFRPVVDGHTILYQPWTSETCGAGIPILMGITHHESVLFQPEVIECSNDANAATHVATFPYSGSLFLNEQASENIVEKYRELYPEISPAELSVTICSDIWMRQSTHLAALSRVDLKNSPTFFYEFMWETPCLSGSWSVHAMELPFIFGMHSYPQAWDENDSDSMRQQADPSGQRILVSKQMINVWSRFAYSGSPALPFNRWEQYSTHNFEIGLLGAFPKTNLESTKHTKRLQIIKDLKPGW